MGSVTTPPHIPYICPKWHIIVTGATSEKAIRLCESLIEEHILLVPPDDPHESDQTTNRVALKTSLPVIAPIFVAHFMTAIGEIYEIDTSATG